MTFKKIVFGVALFSAGLVLGGYLFTDTQPRSLLAFIDCKDRCYKPNELAGLVASVLIHRAPGIIPSVEMESDQCIAVKHPFPSWSTHYVLFPKHDTRNITTLTAEDIPFVLGCFAMARQLVARDDLTVYRLQTNGPGFQDVAYLHFHLVGR